eukprot:CAMPEP_0172213474 /NCGR_PEP_ID=MMETSP1050-20130122/37613_1 /TAXON_ID=233186 /ORGANISM="Cryptomonas curvata, Strain CCAP979/52" /LENGTH=243 /DNA_ID=CAMNT_0012894311 /DNA_START=98 /DNA_END=825 /DNA_ORIENTATION=-
MEKDAPYRILEDREVFANNPDLLINTPSRKDGIDEATETALRIYGCELIQEAGILLRMHQTAMATGQILFHRFYFRCSFRKCDARVVAKAALLMASKVEEQPRQAPDILSVFHAAGLARKGARPEPLEFGTPRYLQLKQELLDAESSLLRELGFMVHAEHAHKYVLYYVNVLYSGVGFDATLAQKAWSYVNDSYRTVHCVRFGPSVLACAAIYLAARDLKIALPESPPWWSLFDAPLEDIQTV